MLGDVADTQVVGFATTIDEKDSDQIMSLQAIYYSTNQSICSCLAENPTMSRDTVKIEPIPDDESFLDRLSREGKLDTFVNLMISSISLILGVAILVCILCYFSRKKTAKKQCAFDAYIYVDLQMKTELRLKAVTEATADVQKNGYTGSQPAGGMATVQEEGEELDQLQDISNPGSPDVQREKKKSGRTRSMPPDFD